MPGVFSGLWSPRRSAFQPATLLILVCRNTAHVPGSSGALGRSFERLALQTTKVARKRLAGEIYASVSDVAESHVVSVARGVICELSLNHDPLRQVKWKSEGEI
jgi:hypothetical protein